MTETVQDRVLKRARQLVGDFGLLPTAVSEGATYRPALMRMDGDGTHRVFLVPGAPTYSYEDLAERRAAIWLDQMTAAAAQAVAPLLEAADGAA